MVIMSVCRQARRLRSRSGFAVGAATSGNRKMAGSQCAVRSARIHDGIVRSRNKTCRPGASNTDAALTSKPPIGGASNGYRTSYQIPFTASTNSAIQPHWKIAASFRICAGRRRFTSGEFPRHQIERARARRRARCAARRRPAEVHVKSPMLGERIRQLHEM